MIKRALLISLLTYLLAACLTFSQAQSIKAGLILSPLIMIYEKIDHKFTYKVKWFIFFICLCVGSIISILFSPFAILFGQTGRLNQITGQVTYHLTSFFLSVSLDISSYHIPEVYKPAVLIMNHQSEFDVFIVGRLLRKNVSIVGKRELIFIPVFGVYFWLANNILLQRKKREEAHKMFDDAAAKMKKDELSIIIFPEGTRSYSSTPTLLPFKKGAFHLAVKSGAPIIPIVAENYAQTGVFDARKKIFGKGKVKVRVLDPIETTQYTSSHEDINALSDRCEKLIMETLMEMSGKPEKQE